MNILAIIFIVAGLFFMIVSAVGVFDCPMYLVVRMPFH